MLRRLQKEVTGRVRALRFFDHVRKLQQGDGAWEGPSAGGVNSSPSRQRVVAGKRPEQLCLLSCCGHVGETQRVQRAASEQLCFEHPACQAPARPSCVIPVAELGKEAGGGGAVGVKLAGVIGLVQRIPKSERVLVFVQFPDLLDKVCLSLLTTP